MNVVAALSRIHVGTAVLGGFVLVIARNLIRGPRTASNTPAAGQGGKKDAVSPEVAAARQGVAFRALAAILTSVDDIVWLVTLRWVGYMLRSKRMHSLPKPGEKVR